MILAQSFCNDNSTIGKAFSECKLLLIENYPENNN
jgi:hypothetical protein